MGLQHRANPRQPPGQRARRVRPPVAEVIAVVHSIVRPDKRFIAADVGGRRQTAAERRGNDKTARRQKPQPVPRERRYGHGARRIPPSEVSPRGLTPTVSSGA